MPSPRPGSEASASWTSSCARAVCALPPNGRVRVDGHTPEYLRVGWEAACSAPDACPGPEGLDGLSWLAARVPGTAARVLQDAERLTRGDTVDLDGQDWWFRTRFSATPVLAQEEVLLRFDGLATVAEVYLNGELVLESQSMFAAHAVDVSARLREDNELAIRFRALAELLSESRRPRARWRTRLVNDGNLRFFRTMLIGRCPGFAPGPAAVGPWREVYLDRRREVTVDALALTPGLQDEVGVLGVDAELRVLSGPAGESAQIELTGPTGTHAASLSLSREGDVIRITGEARVTGVARWWPHTHGTPELYRARLLLGGGGAPLVLEAGRVGFRELSSGPTPAHDVERDGLDLHINGQRVFARGAVWTSADPVGLNPDDGVLRRYLERARDAGMNMLRVSGIGAYETERFHDLCDELGILVWQDLMFANLDYPLGEEAFHRVARDEARGVLRALRGRPSFAVLCGNSEIEQQVAMLGLDPALGRGAFFGAELEELAQGAGVVAVPSAPCGGDLPFRPDRGVANYFGVGAYRRELDDARRADVRFASECLAFANVPDREALSDMPGAAPTGPVVHDPAWKAGVPRDVGSGWDFEDVRDHYLQLLYGVDPGALRSVDHERYLELSRAVSGEVIAETFGEWRRAASRCAGALVLWLGDLRPGAGWGVLDHRGVPKVAYHHLRRALAPVAVWMTDEGLGGIVVHVSNEHSCPLHASLRVTLYHDRERPVEQAITSIELGAHEIGAWNVEALLGRFLDASWTYRFGPPAHDLVVASLEHAGDGPARLLSQTMRFPVGRPTDQEDLARVGLQADAALLDDGKVSLRVSSRRVATGVRVRVAGFEADDDAFCVEPGGERMLLLTSDDTGRPFAGGLLTALNLRGSVPIALTGGALPDPPTRVADPRA